MGKILLSGEGLNPVIAHRDLLADVLNENGLLGEGAEIGVEYGPFSAYLLAHWKGRKLHSIDPWRYFADGEWTDAANRAQAEQDLIYSSVRMRLAPFRERSKVHRQTSAEAAPGFADGQLDFAYIDAQHHYEAVRDDLARWWPKIRGGGILCGHDYLDGDFLPFGIFGVRRAVDEFARLHGLTVLTTTIFDREGRPASPSWFLVRPA